MAYRTTPQVSTRQSPFYLLYGQDVQPTTALDFYTPGVKSLTVESEYSRELFQVMKQIRQVVWQRIKKAQRSQKDQYDKHVKESKIEVDDLVMLKVEPTFKLDRTFHGLYRVHNVTFTCTGIQPINSTNEETVFVLLQRLSCYHGSLLENIKLWLGHGKKRRHHRVLSRADANEPVRKGTNKYVTISGQVVKKLIHYQVGW